MSASRPKADIRPGAQNVRLVPKADIYASSPVALAASQPARDGGQRRQHVGVVRVSET